MQLHPGMKSEYQKRHDEIWPEIITLLNRSGIRNYSIHLDSETNTLFAYLERMDINSMDVLGEDPVMKKWWAFMKDIMTYNSDGRPNVTLLDEVFFMS